MKSISILAILGMVGCAYLSSHASGGRFHMFVRVHDEMDNPVKDARVFGKAWDPYKKTTRHSDGTYQYGFDEQTDKSGLVPIDGVGHTDANIMIEKTGYYTTETKFKFANNPELTLVDERWQPLGMTNDFVLKRIRNPVPMYEKTILGRFPVRDTFTGYDMLVGDWVAPHGNGRETDMEVLYSQTVISTNRFGVTIESDTRLTLRFPRNGDGIVQSFLDTSSGSEFQTAYQAPETGYVKELSYRRSITKKRGMEANSAPDHCHYIRIRTEKDANNHIVRAMYGMFVGSLTEKMQYYVNPDGTRNVEYNPTQNLFQKHDN